MTSVQEIIRDASTRNAQLLQALHETDSAPSKLAQQQSYIQDLNVQLQKTERHVDEVRGRTKADLKEHKKYSESTFRRLAHKASGRKERFEAKAAKEERDYFDAIQEQKTVEDQLAYVRQLKAEAEAAREGFEQQCNRHEELQRELDELYNSIFAGHTPGFPDEDAKERACQAAMASVQRLNQTLEKERHVLFLLRKSSEKLTEAREYLDKAHSMSSMDMLGGGSLVSMQKRNYLEYAESSIQQVRMLQNQIQQIAPHIDGIGPMDIASGSIWGDVVFDNIFSDMDMHDKIKNSEMQIDRAGNRCGQLVREAEGKERAILANLERASDELKQRRVELQQAREDVFQRVADGEQIDGVNATADAGPGSGIQDHPDEAPPPYSAA